MNGPPIDFLGEVAAYDRKAEVGHWDGPRHRMTYRMLGQQGPTLVLLPGLASTYRGYAPTLIRLAHRFRTVAIDYPGDHPDDGARLASIGHDDLVDDLFGLLDHLGAGRSHLFGLSFGSTLTLRALHREPGRFGASAIQGGFARLRFSNAERIALALGRRFQGSAARLPFHDRALARRNRSTFPAGTDDRWAHYLGQNGLTPIASLTHRLDLARRLDLRPILPEIGVPLLLIHGTADRIVDPSHLDELARGLRSAGSVLMPGVGHQPHYTHPEELAELVGHFIADRSGIVDG